ncbi:hypothetical protein M569_05723, partial [Genlisea aurea]
IVGAEFTMESLEGDQKAMAEVEKAKSLQMRSSDKSCWVNAYENVFSGCSKIVADEELKARLTWDLSDCFQEHSGRPAFPYCNPKYPTKKCLQELDDNAHKVYLQYFLQIEPICHQLQIHAFKHQTERLINELKRSAEYAEEKLKIMEERGDTLLHNSMEIHGSLSSIDLQTQKVAETSRNVQENVNVLRRFSEEIHDQSKGIAASQAELNEGQLRMKEKMEDGMKMLHESYDNLGSEISNLKNETVEMEKEIDKLGETMFSKMDSLQNKADDIENIAENSLDKQKQLLEIQATAIEGLKILRNFQSQAIEESRDNLRKLSEFGKKQQEELLLRQEQLQQTNDQLAENSQRILTAQEVFESKQAGMLSALEKLFALHNALLVESRLIKIFIIYSLLIFVLYMFTSMKQTYSIRPRLYLGLCATFSIEVGIIRSTGCSLEQQTWLVRSTRSLFLILAAAQFLYALYTYRDYEVLNHQILVSLIEKINAIEEKRKAWECESESDNESEIPINWGEWMKERLSEEEEEEDPDYSNSIIPDKSSSRYNLRNR